MAALMSKVALEWLEGPDLGTSVSARTPHVTLVKSFLRFDVGRDSTGSCWRSCRGKWRGEAADLRRAENATNKTTVEDAIASQTVVAAAVVLRVSCEEVASVTTFILLSKADPRAFEIKSGIRMGEPKLPRLGRFRPDRIEGPAGTRGHRP